MVKQNILIMSGDETIYHGPKEVGTALKDFLSSNGHRTTLSDNVDMFLPENIKDFDVIVFYMNKQKMTKKQEKGLTECVSGFSGEIAGKPKGFIGLHIASCSFTDSQKYTKMLGATFIAHPPMGEELLIKVKDSEHPIMNNIKDFKIIDEFYMMEVFPPFHTLLTCEYKGFALPITWVKPFGMGRIFYNALGHSTVQINNKTYQ